MAAGGMVGFGNPNFENAPPRKGDDDSVQDSDCCLFFVLQNAGACFGGDGEIDRKL